MWNRVKLEELPYYGTINGFFETIDITERYRKELVYSVWQITLNAV